MRYIQEELFWNILILFIHQHEASLLSEHILTYEFQLTTAFVSEQGATVAECPVFFTGNSVKLLFKQNFSNDNQLDVSVLDVLNTKYSLLQIIKSNKRLRYTLLVLSFLLGQIT